MTKNRLLRVFVPLVIGWIVLVPLVYSGFQFALAGGGREGLAAAKAFFQDGPLYPNLTLSHLWFLWDLLIFYAAAIVIMALVKRMPENFRKSVLDLFGRLALSIWGLVALILISWITLMPMTYAGLNTSTSLFPPVRILVAYGVFFGFGWLLFNRKELVDTFPQRGWMNLIAGTLFGIAYYHFVFRVPLFADPDVLHLFGTGLCAATMWLLTYGFMGVFVRYLDGARPWVRYMSDASYWIYLVHLPLTIWLPGLLVGTAFPATAKFVIVLCGTTLITVLSYHYFVRSTAIGWLLNGRKYPRALPKYDAAGELVKAR